MRGTVLNQGGSARTFASQTNSWTVPAGQRPIRLDAFVRRCLPHLSVREIRKAIEAGNFWLNRRPGRKGERLFGGEVLIFQGPPQLLASSPLPEWDLEVSILYEDESILVVDKPAGMATHGFSGKGSHTLANFLVAHWPFLAGVGKSRWEPGLVHRLDQETSGVVLIAKEQEAFENLRSQFRRRSVQKGYWALAWGRTEREGVIAYPLIHDPRDRRKMKAILEEGSGRSRAKRWQAVTRFRTLGQAKGVSLLKIEMESGVTHQIRAHLAAIGHPIVGDAHYGEERPNPFDLGRHFLHAFYLGFRHPKDNREVAFESALPQELREILDRLGISNPDPNPSVRPQSS